MSTTAHVAIAILVATTGLARAEPDAAKRKATPDKFTKAAGEAFREAFAADQKGDLPSALGLYKKAFEISAHPSTAYNIADVERRLGQLPRAVESYELYLGLAPTAPDRKEVEALIEKLLRTPGTLVIKTGDASDPNSVDFKSSYVLVDGEIKVKPGTVPTPLPQSGTTPAFAISVPAGPHTVDVITPLTYGTQTCTVSPGGQVHCRVSAKPRIDGRVVVSASDRDFDHRTAVSGRWESYQRLELAPGKRKLLLRDRSFECPALVLEVAGGSDVTYAFVSSTEYDGVARCRTLDITRHKLAFEP